jgi:hypothetical protein
MYRPALGPMPRGATERNKTLPKAQRSLLFLNSPDASSTGRPTAPGFWMLSRKAHLHMAYVSIRCTMKLVYPMLFLLRQ